MNALSRLELKLSAEGAKPAAKGYTPKPYTAEADENVVCPKCSKRNDDDAKFCDQCGFKLAGAEGVVVTKSQEDPEDNDNDEDEK